MCSCDDEESLSKYMNRARFHVLKPLDRRSFSILWHQACWLLISLYREIEVRSREEGEGAAAAAGVQQPGVPRGGGGGFLTLAVVNRQLAGGA